MIDPDRLPEVEGARAPFRDDGFAALELSIAPERVTPILRRLVPVNTRARVYDDDGTLVSDTAQLLGGQIARPDTTADDNQGRSGQEHLDSSSRG